MRGASTKSRDSPGRTQPASGKAPRHTALEAKPAMLTGGLASSPFPAMTEGRELMSFGHTGSPAPRLVLGLEGMFGGYWLNE